MGEESFLVLNFPCPRHFPAAIVLSFITCIVVVILTGGFDCARLR